MTTNRREKHVMFYSVPNDAITVRDAPGSLFSIMANGPKIKSKKS
jgi:hypothetical protein